MQRPDASKVKVGASYAVTATWDFEIDITQQSFLVNELTTGIPLAGTWTFELSRQEGGKIKASVLHGHLEPGALGQAVKAEVDFQWVDEREKGHSLSRSTWPPDPVPNVNAETQQAYGGFSLTLEEPSGADLRAHGFRYNPQTQRKYRVDFELERSFPRSPSLTATELAERVSHTSLEQLPHDVRLFFPHAHTHGAELWTSSSLLRASSPYFRSLFGAHFAETFSAKSRRGRKQESGGRFDTFPVDRHKLSQDFEDSDRETDSYSHFKRPPKLDQPWQAEDVPYYQLDVTDTAFTTYQALLVYLQTNLVRFAPLTSSCSPTSATSSKRRDVVIQQHQQNPALPLPVSPKSLFRLASFLDIPQLETLCLDTIKSSLTLDSAAVELFCATSLYYSAVRRVVLDYVKENFEEVQKTRSWRDKVRLIHVGELPEAAPVLLELLEAVAKLKDAK